MSMTSIDVLKLVAICLAFLVLALLWVYRFKRDDLPWTFKTVLSVTSRVIFVEGAVIAVVCYGCEVSVDGLLKLIPFFVIGLLLSNRYVEYIVPPVDNILFAAVISAFLVTCILPFYIIKQFVIGFPDRRHFKKLTESPEPYTPTKPVEIEITPDAKGVVSAALRPLGKVDVDGQSHNARHIGSAFVDTGTAVVVCGQQKGVLFVKEDGIEA